MKSNPWCNDERFQPGDRFIENFLRHAKNELGPADAPIHAAHVIGQDDAERGRSFEHLAADIGAKVDFAVELVRLAVVKQVFQPVLGPPLET